MMAKLAIFAKGLPPPRLPKVISFKSSATAVANLAAHRTPFSRNFGNGKAGFVQTAHPLPVSRDAKVRGVLGSG